MLLLRACPRCGGALVPEYDLRGGWSCLNCGCILREGLQLPYVIAKRPPGRPAGINADVSW